MTPVIGTTYLDRNKRLCTVVDVWQTYNVAGDLVQTRYVCSHEFCGQTVTERDVLAITIQKAIESERSHAENVARITSRRLTQS